MTHEQALSDGWHFGFSDTLGKKIGYRKTLEETEVVVQDTPKNVHYSAAEVNIIRAHGGKIPPEVHLIKKVFDGIIEKQEVQDAATHTAE